MDTDQETEKQVLKNSSVSAQTHTDAHTHTVTEGKARKVVTCRWWFPEYYSFSGFVLLHYFKFELQYLNMKAVNPLKKSSFRKQILEEKKTNIFFHIVPWKVQQFWR